MRGKSIATHHPFPRQAPLTTKGKGFATYVAPTGRVIGKGKTCVIDRALPGIPCCGPNWSMLPLRPPLPEVAMILSRLRPALLALGLAASLPALACSEGLFNSGKGLAYQGYLAPRPATVLIYSTKPGSEREALLAGLQRAGHRVAVASDTAGLTAALAANQVDVVITDIASVDAVTSSDAHPRVLPVVARGQRGSLRDRFPVVVVDGASLGQYLRGINRLLDAKGR
jgi:hypothetical protein